MFSDYFLPFNKNTFITLTAGATGLAYMTSEHFKENAGDIISSGCSSLLNNSANLLSYIPQIPLYAGPVIVLSLLGAAAILDTCAANKVKTLKR